MKRTGRYIAKEEYKNIFGSSFFEGSETKIVISRENNGSGVVLKQISDFYESEYFEPEYQFVDGETILRSRSAFRDAWFLNITKSELTIHKTNIHHAFDLADKVGNTQGFFSSREALSNYVSKLL